MYWFWLSISEQRNMSSVVKKRSVSGPFLLACGLGIGIFVACRRYNWINKLKSALGYIPKLHRQDVSISSNPKECELIVDLLRKDTAKYSVLGFDCEWVTVNGVRRPVALLQLASQSGLCALIRLCQIKYIPPQLYELLEDENVIKVGVSPQDDAKYLLRDYGVNVRSTLDLRFVAQLLRQQPESLAKMAKSHVGIELNKNWRIRCSSWDSGTLTEEQIDYAAKDALVAIEIFKKFSMIFTTQFRGSFDDLMHLAKTEYLNKPFKYKGLGGIPGQSGRKKMLVQSIFPFCPSLHFLNFQSP